MQGGIQRLNMSEFGGVNSQQDMNSMGGQMPAAQSNNSQSWLSQHGNKLYGRQSDKNAYASGHGQSQLKQKSNYPLSTMEKKPSKANNSMLNAMPQSNMDQADIVARRHTRVLRRLVNRNCEVFVVIVDIDLDDQGRCQKRPTAFRTKSSWPQEVD